MSMLASMLPPERSAQTGPSPGTLPGEERGDRGRPGPLDRKLAALRDEQDGTGDLRVGHRYDRLEPALQDAPRQLAGMLHRDAVRDRAPGRRHPGEGRARGRLDADDAELRAHLAERERDPCREPAAADRHDDRPHLRPELLGELEPERALAGEDQRVLEGVDVGLARLDPLLRGRRRRVEAQAGEDDLGAVALRRLELGRRRVLRHEDRCAHAVLARSPGDRLAVVAGARRDHPGGALGVRQAGDPVEGAADLEGARALEVLGLEPDRPAGEAAERLRRDDRRLARDPLQAPARLLDLSERRARHPAPRTPAP